MNNPAILRWAAVVLLVLAVTAIVLLTVPAPSTNPRVTDAQLAARINGAVGTVNGHPVTAADVPEIVGFACSPDPRDRAGYAPAVVSLVEASGRCAR